MNTAIVVERQRTTDNDEGPPKLHPVRPMSYDELYFKSGLYEDSFKNQSC